MRRFALSILMGIMAITFIPTTAFAACSQAQLDNGCVSTNIIGDGCSCDDGKGSGVSDILNLVVDIMTIGIGILGLIGISVVGIQYLTAGGNEEKAKKAKRRMFEIVLGLAAYVLLYAVLKWLLPGFN